MRINVTLDEAILGFKRTIKHLDGRDVTLIFEQDTASSKRNKPLQKGSIRVVSECGMPMRGRPGRYGDLYIEFDVKVPTNFSSLTDTEQFQLATLLKKAAENDDKSTRKKAGEKVEKDVRYLRNGSASDFGKGSDSQFGYDDHSYMEDDDEDDLNPFGNPFGDGTGNGFRSFSYTNFGGSASDGSNVQCQQM